MKAIGYAWSEALIGVRRAPGAAAMSAATIAVAFLTLGGFLLAAANLQRVVDRWSEAAELSIYLRDDITEEQRRALEEELGRHRAVTAVEYISREDALARFTAEFPELADIAGGAEHPFPASVEVRLQPDAASAAAADALVDSLPQQPGVADVRYDPAWIARLVAIVTGVRLLGIAIAAVLVVGAAITVAAVVRLSLAARRDELEIMQLVGAPFSFIRGPSVAEGMLLGGAGAIVALLVLQALYRRVRAGVDEAFRGLAGMEALRFLEAGEALMLVGVALAVGGLTGALVARSVR